MASAEGSSAAVGMDAALEDFDEAQLAAFDRSMQFHRHLSYGLAMTMMLGGLTIALSLSWRTCRSVILRAQGSLSSSQAW